MKSLPGAMVERACEKLTSLFENDMVDGHDAEKTGMSVDKNGNKEGEGIVTGNH